MKLLIENWRKYLKESEEDELEKDLLRFIRNNDLDKEDIQKILAGDDVLQESIGQDLSNLYKKYGKRAITAGLMATIGLGAATAHMPSHGPNFSDTEVTQMYQADTGRQTGDAFINKVEAALSEIYNSLKEKIPVDIRMGAKYLIGETSETTNKDFTKAEINFLASMVAKKFEGGEKGDIVINYDDWDNAAKEQGKISSLYDVDASTQSCKVKMDKGEAMPGYCYGQGKPDSIVSNDTAVQMKRVFGAVKVTKVSDGKYEFNDIYDFNKGKSAGIFDELVELVKDLTDSKNDQKSYTAMRRLFQMRGSTGYEGYPIKVSVELGVPTK